MPVHMYEGKLVKGSRIREEGWGNSFIGRVTAVFESSNLGVEECKVVELNDEAYERIQVDQWKNAHALLTLAIDGSSKGRKKAKAIARDAVSWYRGKIMNQMPHVKIQWHWSTMIVEVC